MQYIFSLYEKQWLFLFYNKKYVYNIFSTHLEKENTMTATQ